jgi:hypothetical protein
MADLNKATNNGSTNVSNNNSNAGVNEMNKQEVTQAVNELKDALNVDEATADDILSNIASEVAGIMDGLTGIEKLKLDVLANISPSEMFVILQSDRDHPMVSSLNKACRKLEQGKQNDQRDGLVLDFWLAWKHMWTLSEDQFTGYNLTKADQKQLLSKCMMAINKINKSERYLNAMERLNNMENSAELLANVGYQTTKIVGAPFTRVPEGTIEIMGQTAVNGFKAVNKVINNFKVEIDKTKKINEINKLLKTLEEEKAKLEE